MMEQTEAAIAEADILLLLVDGVAGITPHDEYFADMVRKSGKPVLLVVNKAESKRSDSGYTEAFALGLGEPVAISAEHREGMNSLYEALDALLEHHPTTPLSSLPPTLKGEEDSAATNPLPEGEGSEVIDRAGEGAEYQTTENNTPMQVAFVGRPNAGKSTLVNALLEEDRVLTGPEAGITRDAIAVDFTFEGRPLKLVDTAGVRRKSNVREKLEKMAVGDSLRTIRFAHVVVLLLDAEQPLEKQDLTLADLIEREGRAIVIAVNKWDKVTDEEAWKKALAQRLESTLTQLRGVPLIPISALNRSGLTELLHACFDAYEIWNRRIPTAALNRWLEDTVAAHPPPMVSGRRLNLKYITQVKSRPPTFVLAASRKNKLPESYQRYLVNSLREMFDLPGVPIRMRLKSGKNPYADKS